MCRSVNESVVTDLDLCMQARDQVALHHDVITLSAAQGNDRVAFVSQPIAVIKLQTQADATCPMRIAPIPRAIRVVSSESLPVRRRAPYQIRLRIAGVAFLSRIEVSIRDSGQEAAIAVPAARSRLGAYQKSPQHQSAVAPCWSALGAPYWNGGCTSDISGLHGVPLAPCFTPWPTRTVSK